MKKLSFLSAMLLLTLAVIELMALFTDRLLHGEPSIRSKLAYPGPSAHAKKVVSRVSHPFFGHVPRRWQALNIMPPPRREDAFVIALLGGSVAEGVAVELRNALLHRSFRARTRARTRAGAGTRQELGTVVPVLVDLTNGGAHQPFQAAALANMIANGGQFDAVVVVDGYNELAHPLDRLSLGLHPLYPYLWSSSTKVTPAQRAIVGRIDMLRREQRDLLRGRTTGFSRHSAVFRLIRHFRLNGIDRRLVLAHYELASASGKSYRLERHGPRRVYTEQERGEIGTEAWYRGALLLATLAERHGAEYYHFLQPNQHVPDTKELSRREVALVHQMTHESREALRQGYPVLQQYGRLLRSQGFKFFDLSWIYKDHPETPYIDSCCHVNKRGNELLAAGIVSRIAAEKGFLGGGIADAGGAWRFRRLRLGYLLVLRQGALPVGGHVRDLFSAGGPRGRKSIAKFARESICRGLPVRVSVPRYGVRRPVRYQCGAQRLAQRDHPHWAARRRRHARLERWFRVFAG